ncbi:MAG: TRAP transporter substrate-binding protein DctP, partial [Candidatus Rokubacteria bacterium]|nr:TRAP transporter substrate-binding protein DctP [Candidatus Rokubacteria bacterium]
MKRILMGVLVATGLLLAAPVHARTLTIKLGTLAPEGSSFYRLIRDMAEAWQEASGGRIRVRIYPGGVAGDDPDMVRKMRVGQLQAAAA